MQDRPPLEPDNRRATGIAVASIAALLLAVALAKFGVLSPPQLSAPQGLAPNPEKAFAPAPSRIGATRGPKDAALHTDRAGTVQKASLKSPVPKHTPLADDPLTGEASWYDFEGQTTANGETMDPDRLTAAHPTLPFGTKLEVENVENGRTVVVRVNDRGPYDGDRIIDVSKEAAERLDMVEDGVTEVEVAPVPTDSVDDPGEPIQ